MSNHLYSRAERARREVIVVQQLEELSVSSPPKFDEMLMLLAKLVAETEAEAVQP